MLRIRKALNIPNRCPDCHRRHDTEAWQLQQTRDLLLLVGNLFHHGGQTELLCLCKPQGLEVTEHIYLFQGSQCERQPPILLRLMERIPFRWKEMTSLQNRMQAVLRLRSQSCHLFALCHQTAQFTHRLWWNPNPHQQSLG